MKLASLDSMRGRLILFASLMGIAVLGLALFGHLKSVDADEALSDSQSRRSVLLGKLQGIRQAIIQTHNALHLFLLDPAGVDREQNVRLNLDHATRYVNELNGHPWLAGKSIRNTGQALISNLTAFATEVEELITTRKNARLQFPALAHSNNVMRPSRRNANSAIALVVNQVAGENNPKLYALVVAMRAHWKQMVSNYRLYLANRVGSFGEADLPRQEESIDILFQSMFEKISLLRKMDEAGELEFEVSDAFNDFAVNAINWYEKGFVEVRRIHHTDAWRMDAKLVTQILSPRLGQISDLLNIVGRDIEILTSQRLTDMLDVSDKQTTIIWAITGLGFCFLLACLLAMEKLVFRPLALVANALKSEGEGNKEIILPRSLTTETRDLVQAFEGMRMQVHNRQMALEYQALHDTLTGLPNRALLEDRLIQEIFSARRDGGRFALVFVDLDRFKEVNDTLGHAVGDMLLRDVGARIQKALRTVDTVARMGGDEFAILLPGSDERQVLQIAAKVVDSLKQEFMLEGIHVYTDASLGIAVYPGHGIDSKTLIQHADVAMYVAKRDQAGPTMYNPQHDRYSRGRLALISDMRDAVDQGELSLHYQPIIDINDGSIVGAEALLRWVHPQYGQIPADQLITMAEQTGQINKLTLKVLDRALAQHRAWFDDNIDLNLSVNLSAYDLKNPDIVRRIQEVLTKNGIPANSLTLELTESAMMVDLVNVVEILTQLDRMGVQIAIDDFGTGFSSLSYLKTLPVDVLKIDRSFIANMDHEENDAIIVRSTIDLAHNLGLRVVAEGVETSDALGLLGILSCDSVQGFHLSKPMDGESFKQWYQQWQPGKDICGSRTNPLSQSR